MAELLDNKTRFHTTDKTDFILILDTIINPPNQPFIIMELTSEQQAIINSNGNIKINAVAGSGKTTTIIEYAKAQACEFQNIISCF